MVDKTITMDVNEVLELDYLVEEISDNSIKFDQNPSNSNINYISNSTRTNVGYDRVLHLGEI